MSEASQAEDAVDTGDQPAAETAPSADQLSIEIKELRASQAALERKNAELLTETKRAKSKRREVEESQLEAAAEAARKSGNFEELYRSSEADRAAKQEEYSALLENISADRCQREAMKIAVHLADGDNAEILGEFISKRLRYQDDELHVLDTAGQLTVMRVDELKAEFEGDQRWSSLRRARKATGGGAVGGVESGGAASKTITRADYDTLTSAARLKFAQGRGKILD
jgi:hypothetical protein